MEQWEPGDRVFIFGFSRGAYTARVLAGLLHNFGLMPRGAYNLLPYVIKNYRALSDRSNKNQMPQIRFRNITFTVPQGQCLAMDMWFIAREKNLFAGHLRRAFLSSRA
jgi:uncharacterized protein (DUF2235 family)